MSNTSQSTGIDNNERKPRKRGFILHLHPVILPKDAIVFNRTFGLGGMAALLFVIQVFTGTLLRFVYEPIPEKAYDSILFIQQNILFGQLVRNIHHWSGIFFVIITFLHLLRTFYAQAFFTPRRINWVIGVGLLLIVTLSNFTGYLLPWDQLAYWAITVSTSILEYIPVAGTWLMNIVRGDNEVGSATLLNFYTLHTGILPVILVILMVFHFWRVRKAKGIALPGNMKNMEKVPANPNLVLRELVVGLVLIAFILFLSVFFDAPLLEKANPAFSPNPAKAPWYFMGVQELLLHFHPLFAAVIIPLVFFIGMFYLPYVSYSDIRPGYWFGSELGKKLAVRSAMLALVITPLAILGDEYLLDFEGWMKGIPILISNGLIPLVLLLFTITGYIILIKKRYKASRIEWVIALFTVIVVSYSVLTIIGIWFRGPGMHFMLPWEIN